MLSPCKDCPDRALHCHSRCEKYQIYTEWCEARREKRKQEQAADDAAAQRGYDKITWKKILKLEVL